MSGQLGRFRCVYARHLDIKNPSSSDGFSRDNWGPRGHVVMTMQL